MKILFTGGSSFSGMWFVEELAKAGHEVVAIIRHAPDYYTDLRKIRIERLGKFSKIIFSCPYGEEHFLKLIQSTRFDIFCHHAADVANYKSPDFNAVNALGNNTGAIRSILSALSHSGCQKILLTGSVFEQNEGAGSDGLRAVSPYGLSKGLTFEMFRYYSQIMGMQLGKFVIPNPFGPYEEFRFTSFLIQNWFAKRKSLVTQPAYVRDNIPVSLLAKAYVHFAESLPMSAGFQKINPSGYPESQGAFTTRFALEMRNRLNLPCEFELGFQTDFPEPKVRINTDLLDSNILQWNEKNAWDELAAYYSSAQSSNGNTTR